MTRSPCWWPIRYTQRRSDTGDRFQLLLEVGRVLLPGDRAALVAQLGAQVAAHLEKMELSV